MYTSDDATLNTPSQDEAAYLVTDEDWAVLAVHDVEALAGESGASFVGWPVRDIIGAEPLAQLQATGTAVVTLESVDYVLTAYKFSLPGQTLRLVRAQERQATIEHVVSLIVHELRNPLSAVRALVQGLEEEISDRPEQLAFTSRIGAEIERLSRLLTSMAQVARLRARPPELLQPLSALEYAAQVIRPELERRGISLTVTATQRVGPILADPDQIQQVLLNLLRNAADAMPQGGTITARARLDPRGRTVIQIEDSGVGMDERALERALRPGNSSKPGGMGLGLMIVRGIVRQHGGRMRIVSTPGKGTTVSITFPPSGSHDRPVASPEGR